MIVRFYLTFAGRNPVEEFLREQSVSIRSDFLDAISLLTDGHALSMPISRPLPGIHPGLHELRLKDRHGQVRIFYYIKRGEAIYMLHAFKKKTQTIPQREIDVVVRRLREV